MAKPRLVKNWRVRSNPGWQDDVGPPWHHVTRGGLRPGGPSVPAKVGRYSVPWTSRPDRPVNAKGSPEATSPGPRSLAVGGRRGRAGSAGVHTHTFAGASGVLPISAKPSPCVQSAETDTHG